MSKYDQLDNSGKTQVGTIGMPEPKILKAYDLKTTPAICNLSLHTIRDICKNRKMAYRTPGVFPSMTRDIALQVSRNAPAEDLLRTIWKNGSHTLVNVSLFDIYQSEDVGDSNKSLAFSLKYQSETTTLTDSEVDEDVETILKSLKELHGASQR